MSAAMGQDLKSSTIQLGIALQDPIKGLTSLSRIGVTFTAKQKKQIHNRTLFIGAGKTTFLLIREI